MQHNEWKNVLTMKFTRLHPKDHNIFSPNKVNSQPVNGMFLSSQTLHQLLNDGTQGTVTEELFIFCRPIKFLQRIFSIKESTL